MSAYLDTSVLVPALLAWHEHHARAAEVIEAGLAAKAAPLHTSAHALFETYAVLTRLPPGKRVPPVQAHHLIEANYAQQLKVLTLPVSAHLAELARLAANGVTGGAVYDGLHLATARHHGLRRLYTFNVADFQRLAGPEPTPQITAP